MKTENRVWAFFAFLIALACVLLITPVYAGGDRVTQSNDMNNQTSGDIKIKNGSSVDVGGTNVEVGGVTVPVTTGSVTQGSVTGGDVSVQGDKNKAYALGMASGSIADCMAHLGLAVVNVPMRNKFCERIDFTAWAENPARHTKTSVIIRCSTKIASEIFGDRDACQTAFVTVEPPDHHLTEIEALRSDNADLERRLDALEGELEVRVAKSEEKARKATLEARYAVREAKKPSEIHPEIQQEIVEYERRLENARLAYSGEK